MDVPIDSIRVRLGPGRIVSSRAGARFAKFDREGAELQFRYLHFVRFCLVNTVAAALAAAAYLQGWLDGVLGAHLVELSGVIFAVFVYGMIIGGAKIWRHGVELNDVTSGRPDAKTRVGRYLSHAAGVGADSRSIHAGALRLKLTDRIVGVRHVANSLIFLGLIGTVIGFIIALSGIDPAAAAEVENIKSMVSSLINGMSVAMYTTLVGAVLHVWLNVSHRILVTGTVDLIDAAIELGESRARA